VSNVTHIEVDGVLPRVRIVREFDAPASQVYRAHIDPVLVAQWLGPEDVTTTVEHWDARSGGSWRYVATRRDFTVTFHGCFHELRPDELIIQTQTYDVAPDRVSLDRMALEAISPSRTRLVCTSLHESFDNRDALIASGMEHGVVEGFQQLDRLLAATPSERTSPPPAQEQR
jgi:uncharacterized protein YndB with AHSA1/START domain